MLDIYCFFFPFIDFLRITGRFFVKHISVSSPFKPFSATVLSSVFTIFPIIARILFKILFHCYSNTQMSQPKKSKKSYLSFVFTIFLHNSQNCVHEFSPTVIPVHRRTYFMSLLSSYFSWC